MTVLDKKKCKQNDACALSMAMRLLCTMKNIGIVVHGVETCSNGYANINSLMKLVNNEKTLILSTDLLNEDLIVGSLHKLEEAVRNLASITSNPIFVLNTCGPAIIGDDISALISSLEKQIPNALYLINSEGIAYSQYYLIYKTIASKVAERFQVNTQKFNKELLLITHCHTGIEDIKAIIKLLYPFDIKPVFFPYYYDMDSRIIPQYNAYICQSIGKRFADVMNDKLMTKTVSITVPVGIGNTNKWLMDIGKTFNCVEKVEYVIRCQMNRYKKELDIIKQKLKGKKVLITGGPGSVLPIVDLCMDLGMEDLFIGLLYTDEIVNIDGRDLSNLKIISNIQFNEIKALIENNSIDIFFGQHGSYSYINSTCIPFIPLSCNWSSHIGYENLIKIGRRILLLINTYKESIYGQCNNFLRKENENLSK